MVDPLETRHSIVEGSAQPVLHLKSHHALRWDGRLVKSQEELKTKFLFPFVRPLIRPTTKIDKSPDLTAGRTQNNQNKTGSQKETKGGRPIQQWLWFVPLLCPTILAVGFTESRSLDIVEEMVTCNACNKEFQDEAEQKLHYRSEWHRYNLKRKVAGVPGVTESLFLAKQSALANEKKKLDEAPMLYTCGLCNKEYRSSKAHAQHLTSKSHLLRASQGVDKQEGESTIIRPLPKRVANKPSLDKEPETEESEESEWEEVDPEEDLVDEATDSLLQLNFNEHTPLEEDVDKDDNDEDDVVDPSCCFMCDQRLKTIESCIVHLHKKHSFFIPDIEYLKDPEGFLTYLGVKVKRDFLCLYCNERCHPFTSLEGVRKHMDAKSHCKVRYGDGADDEEGELEDFYDYSSSYVDAQGNQLVVADDVANIVEVTDGGELVTSRREENKVFTKILGSREFLRYYRQKPRPTPPNMALTASLAARYRSMGLATVQTTREHMVRMKVLKTMNKSGVEAMRSKIAMKSNVIRNLPKNVPY
ncbi:hypothetical protein M9H77_35363 [Catharanthus roseus]|uniref:Uncharacterized protein n=1 Tax=Catharanthus roseus TaxID=4058 RepID=A0ACB9ZQP3_CATRO|nr:hypothetical protein M9H77_35363 [Catharanthus roseus]